MSVSDEQYEAIMSGRRARARKQAYEEQEAKRQAVNWVERNNRRRRAMKNNLTEQEIMARDAALRRSRNEM